MRWLGALAIAVLLLGCGEEPGTPPVGDPALVEAFGEGEWVLVEGVAMVDGYPITLQVRDDGVGGTAACNSYRAEANVDGDRVEIGSIAVTEMGCPEPGVHDSESAYLDAVQAVERYERDDDRLVLATPDLELAFEAAPPVRDAPLTGTDWQLASLLTGTGPNGTASSTSGGSLLLEDGGTFAASDGCNELAGRWERDGDVLRLSAVTTTDVACPPLEQQVEHVHAVLLGDPTVGLQGPELTLTAGERALDYRAP